MRNSTIVLAGMAGAVGFALSRLVAGMNASGGDRSRGQPRIRPAGPENMSNPPRRWSAVDEMSDESFPASDPPGSY